jgi:hypothetical protein
VVEVLIWWTTARTASTGVEGTIPWPRLKMWPYDTLVLDSAPIFDGQLSLSLDQTGHAVEEETVG